MSRAFGRWRDRAWLECAREIITAAWPRRHAARNGCAIAEILAGCADWTTLRTRPTIARLMDEAGLCERAVQYWCRRLEDAGLLRVLEPGTTPQFSPGILARDDGNLAREWQLTRPQQEKCTPSLPAYGCCSKKHPHTHAREAQGQKDRRSAPDSPSLAPPPWRAQANGWPLGQVPQRRGEMLAAAQALQGTHMVLARLSARHLRSILRPWFTAPPALGGECWTPLSIVYAIEHTRDGAPRRHGDRPRDPAGWLRSRLAAWLGPDGQPGPPHTVGLAASAAQHRATAAAYAAAVAAVNAAAAPGPPAAVLAAVRAGRGWDRRPGKDAGPRAVVRPAVTPGDATGRAAFAAVRAELAARTPAAAPARPRLSRPGRKAARAGRAVTDAERARQAAGLAAWIGANLPTPDPS